MLILCNEDEMDKKKLKKVHKIIISEQLENLEEDDFTTHLNQLLPSMHLFHSYINNEINKKKYFKKYIKAIKENEQIYATILTLMMVYKEHKKLALVCTREETSFFYLPFLMQFLHEEFKIPISSYAKWKANDFNDIFNIDKDILKKQIKKYRSIIDGEDEDDYTHEKDKKKKKKSKDPLEYLDHAFKDPLDDLDDFYKGDNNDDSINMLKKRRVIKIKRTKKE